MKITIYIGGLTGGGAERVCCNLASFLVRKGHEVTMLTVSKPNEMSYFLDSRVKLETLETKMRLNSDGARVVIKQLKLFSFVCKHKTDAYVVMLPKTIRSLMIFRRFIKAPIILSERSNPTSYSGKTQAYLKKAARHADGIVLQTEYAKNWYAPYIGHKSLVIPNAVNSEFIRPEYNGVHEKSIVAVGRLSEQKNFTLLLDAFAEVADEFPEYKLKIFGKGPLEASLKEYAKEIGVADRAEFMGYVLNMPEQLERASMFVLSSKFEGMPNALMEAMAIGLPCISTDCPAGGSAFLIEDGENGLLVPVNDKTQMAVAMRRILSDEPFAEKLGRNARKVIERLSSDYIYSRWEEFIKEIVKAK